MQNELKMFCGPVSELAKPKIAWAPLCDTSDNLVHGIEFYGDYAYAVTHEGGPRYKLVRTSIRHPDWKHAETVTWRLRTRSSPWTGKSFLFITYSNGVVGRIVKYDLAGGKCSDVGLPGSGDVWIDCPDFRSDRAIVSITSWTSPTTLYDYDAGKETFRKSIFNTDVTYPGFSDLVTEEVGCRAMGER